MLHFYNREIYIIFEGIKTRIFSGYCLCEENNLNTTTLLSLNWDNLDTILEEYGLQGIVPFRYWECKKGRIIQFYDWYFRSIKEWKNELNMQIEIITDKIVDNEISINEILNYSNSEKAIQYLVEKGINIIQ